MSILIGEISSERRASRGHVSSRDQYVEPRTLGPSNTFGILSTSAIGVAGIASSVISILATRTPPRLDGVAQMLQLRSRAEVVHVTGLHQIDAAQRVVDVRHDLLHQLGGTCALSLQLGEEHHGDTVECLVADLLLELRCEREQRRLRSELRFE